MKENEKMCMTPEAARAEIEYLYEAGREAQKIAHELEAPTPFEAFGRQYVWVGGELRRVEPEHLVKPAPFQTYTLDGLIAYIQADVDGFFNHPERKCLVRVTNATTVEVLSPTTGYYQERSRLAYCEADTPSTRFGAYMASEEFQIMLQSNFLPSDNLALVLKLAGRLKKEQSMQVADDGVSQRVTVIDGVATVADVTVKNPVELVPIRTFREIEQPESPFVLRFNENAQVALFTGDGAAWRQMAVARIAEYLKNNLAGYNVEVIG